MPFEILICPKCKKGNCVNTKNYLIFKCLWCGEEFKVENGKEKK